MKKVLAVLLSVLVIFSACGAVLAFAADEPDNAETYTIKFLNADGSLIDTMTVAAGETPKAPVYPTIANQIDKNDVEYEYIFYCWSVYDEETKKVDAETEYHQNTIPAATADTTYIAVYVEQEVKPTLTFWNLVQSIFARINLLFEYFAKVFFGGKV